MWNTNKCIFLNIFSDRFSARRKKCITQMYKFLFKNDLRTKLSNSENDSTDFFKSLKKGNKILSLRKHENTSTHSCMWFSKNYKNNIYNKGQNSLQNPILRFVTSSPGSNGNFSCCKVMFHYESNSVCSVKILA